MADRTGLLLMSATDADLVSRARRGDLRAYTELIARHRTGLERYAFQILGNREEAEEALQDALLRAYRALDRCDQPGRFRAWLLTILINRCRSRLARRQPMVTGSEGDLALLSAAVPHPEDGAAWLEEIHRALGALPADHREAFLLKHVEQFSYEEMTELTGASVPALKMRVSRACERLRAELREVYHD